MMSLKSTLQKPEFTGIDDEAIVTALSQVVEICKNETIRSAAILKDVLDDDELTLVAGTMLAAAAQSPLYQFWYDQVKSPGINWASQRAAETIDKLAVAGHWPAELTAKLKSVGIVTGPAWQREGLSGLPSIEEIKAAHVQIGLDDVRLKLSQRMNAVVARMDAGELVTWDAVRAELGAE